MTKFKQVSLIVLFLPLVLFSQEKKRRTGSFYLEAFGNGINFPSFNYEHFIGKNDNFALRLGYSKGSDFLVLLHSYTSYSIPMEITYLHGKKQHQLEFGIGVTATKLFWEKRYLPFLRVGSRYTFDNGWFLRIGLTPAWYNLKIFHTHKLYPLIGFSFGHTF
jgi:hypothetical protein